MTVSRHGHLGAFPRIPEAAQASGDLKGSLKNEPHRTLEHPASERRGPVLIRATKASNNLDNPLRLVHSHDGVLLHLHYHYLYLQRVPVPLPTHRAAFRRLIKPTGCMFGFPASGIEMDLL